MQRPVLNDGCSSFFPMFLSFSLSFFFFSHPIQLHALVQNRFPLWSVYTLWCSATIEAAVDQFFTSSYWQKIMFPSTRPLFCIRPLENCCMPDQSHCDHHFVYAVTELSSFSRTAVRFSFPRRVQAYQFHCGRSFVLSNSPPSPEHWFAFLIPQNTAGWSTKLFPFLDMSTNFFISPCLFVTLQRKQKLWWMQSTRDAWREKENVVACS